MGEIPPPRKVLVIGCGYIGTAVGAELVRQGFHVTGTTTTPQRREAIAAAGMSAELLDVADGDRLAELLRGCDTVLLTIAAGRGGDYRRVYLTAASNLAAALDAAPNSRPRRVIYTSSTGVYGYRDGRWVDEDTPPLPDTQNAQILLEAEDALLRVMKNNSDSRRTTVSIVRLAGIYGPGRELAGVARQSAGTQRDDGDAWVNLVHRDDIVVALTKLADTAHEGVLNLNDDHPTTRRELYDRLLAQAELAPVEWIAPPDPPNLGKRVRNGRIKRVLDLKLRYPAHQH